MDIAILCSTQYQRAQGVTVCKALESSLKSLDHNAVLRTFKFHNRGSVDIEGKWDFLILFGLKSMAVKVRERKIPTVIYNFATLYPKEIYRRDWIKNLRKIVGEENVLGVIDYCPNNCPALTKMGFKNVFCPLGYHASFERLDIGHSVDLGFIGCVEAGTRRYKILRSAEDNGFSLNVWNWNFHRNEIEHRKYREDWCLDSKIWLNLHKKEFGGQSFGCIRVISLGISNERCCLTEPCGWMPPPLKVGEDIVVADRSRINEVSRDLIDSGDWRRIADNGYRKIKEEYIFKDHVETAMEEVKKWL